MKWIPLLMILFSIPLMGVSQEEAFGCSCGAAEEKREVTELPTGIGEGISGSQTYFLKRSRIGPSWEPTNSSEWDLYRVKATLGHHTTEGRSISDHYVIHQPMSRDLLIGGSE